MLATFASKDNIVPMNKEKVDVICVIEQFKSLFSEIN